ncbi:quorum-sensing system DWW-type pheromone [Streptococcus pyogenes]|nr:quorum-sensing system DWW-type pheromone [Streptococcus pyogenes]
MLKKYKYYFIFAALLSFKVVQ